MAQQASKRCEGVTEDDLTGRHVMLMHQYGFCPPCGGADACFARYWNRLEHDEAHLLRMRGRGLFAIQCGCDAVTCSQSSMHMVQARVRRSSLLSMYTLYILHTVMPTLGGQGLAIMELPPAIHALHLPACNTYHCAPSSTAMPPSPHFVISMVLQRAKSPSTIQLPTLTISRTAQC